MPHSWSGSLLYHNYIKYNILVVSYGRCLDISVGNANDRRVLWVYILLPAFHVSSPALNIIVH
jgi:hypothetical protein